MKIALQKPVKKLYVSIYIDPDVSIFALNEALKTLGLMLTNENGQTVVKSLPDGVYLNSVNRTIQ